jgi:hypothetical protein
MRNLLILSCGLALLVSAAACDGTGPAAASEPPVLKITSPVRSLVQDHAGQLLVSGTVSPNAKGDPIEKVLVNNVQATVDASGAFHAVVDVGEGATLIETVARDAAGAAATDTRAVQAGALRPVGTNIPSAVTAALSADALAKITAAAVPLLKRLDLAALLAPLQPMVHIDDENGEDCFFARLFVDNVTFSDVKLSLTPVQDGLKLAVEIDGLEVPGHVRFAAACFPPVSTTLQLGADKIAIAGTLQVTPNGMAGFTTKLVDPSVSVTGFRFSIADLPEDLLSRLHLDSAIGVIVSKAAELAMNPLVNQALGALAGPQQLDVLGKKLELQVAPSAVSFDPTGVVIAMDMRAVFAGSSSSPGFIMTDNGTPSLDPAQGFQLGLADDLANELLAELAALGLLDLTVTRTGPYEATQVHMTLPPMISADLADGKLRLVLGDMIATFIDHGAPLAKAAISAKVDLKIAPTVTGYGIALQLGAPEIHVTILDDIANTTGVTDHDLANATAVTLGAQIDSITRLLTVIPVPAVAGLQMHNLSIGSDDGYVLVTGQVN